MIPSVLKKPGLLFLSFAAMLFVVIASSAPAHAATLAEDSEGFLAYRAVHGCLATNDLGNKSPTDVIKGNWWSLPASQDWMGGALITGNDELKASCQNEQGDSYIAKSAGILGFNDAGAMWCSIQPIANRDNEGSGANDFEKCTSGSGEFDASGSKNDQTTQFTNGIKSYSSLGAAAPIEATGAMKYYIYFETFKAFCDAERTKDYVASTDKTLADSNEYVVVNEVVLKNGKYDIVPALYKVGADDNQNHEVAGVWSLPDGGKYNLDCGELAGKTWDFDDAYGLYLEQHPEEGVSDDDGNLNGSTEPVCSAGALGWVICPAINFIATINDGIYSVIENMLIIDPVTVEYDGPLYDTWTKFRDIANVLFVITFFFVIFSQATSVGLSSYGVKKLLPRIIAAAILVNVSFFICQIAIDFSNIIGVSIDKMFSSLQSGNELDINVISWETLIAGILGGGAVFGGAAVILGAGGVTAAMAMMLPFLVTALFAVITAIAVLIARQVLIVLLVVLAPLAFVAFILPNTQKYFQLWQNTFTTLLIMFPLIAALFAGSQLAANIILSSPTDEDGIGLFTLIAAVSMLFIPLFGIPYIVKFSGGALGRVAGVINNPNKGPLDALRKKSETVRDRKQNQAGLRNARGEFGSGAKGYLRKNTFGKYSQRQSRIDAVNQRVKQEADSAKSGYIAEEALKDPKFAERMAGGAAYQGSNLPNAVRQVQAASLAHEHEESRKRVGATQRLLSYQEQGKSFEDIIKMYDAEYAKAAAAGDHETASAVLKSVHVKGGGARDATAQMLQNYAVQGQEAQKRVEETVYQDLQLSQRADVTKGGMGSNGKWEVASAKKMGSEQIARLDKPAMIKAIENKEIFREEAERILSNENLKSQVQDKELEAMLETVRTTGPSRSEDPNQDTIPGL